MNDATLPNAIDWDDGYTLDASISDPATCGEDPVANAQQAIRFAPLLCRDCRTYHLRHMLWRVVASRTSIRNDRAEMFALVRELVGTAAAASPDPLRIVIAGAADTGILATCAHAVALLGPEIAARVNYSLVDVCMTPLALCEAYSRRHGLSVDLHRADLSSLGMAIPADLVVLHSILSYLPATHRRGTMAELRNWLKPQGRMLVSNRIGLAERRRPPDAEIVASYIDRCAGRGIRCRPAEVLQSYLTQPAIEEAEFTHWKDIADLLVSSGLTIERELGVEPRPLSAAEPVIESWVTARYLAVASAQS